MSAPEFTKIYEFLYKTVQNTHKGCMVDQASLMDAAIRLYIYERDKFEDRRLNKFMEEV